MVLRKHDVTNKNTTTYTKTMTNTFRKHLERTILETCDLWDICSQWWDKHDLTNKKTKTQSMTNAFREHLQMAILEKLWNCWHFWQLRTSKHYNDSDLAIKSNTGQESQFFCSNRDDWNFFGKALYFWQSSTVWKYMLKLSALGSATLSDVFNIKHHRLSVPHNIRTREHLYFYTLSMYYFIFLHFDMYYFIFLHFEHVFQIPFDKNG